jgi:hypothetical protein
VTDDRPFTLGGLDVRLAARRPSGDVLVAVLDRQGRPTGAYREARLHELHRIGTPMAALKRRVAALPLAAFEIDAPAPRAASPGFLHAHFAIPEGDR